MEEHEEMHGGHRQRMYNRMRKNALEEHEWLEVLLYGMQPRRNTNEIAHRLIRRFGSTEDVLEASLEELQTVKGVGLQIASHIKCIQHFYTYYKKDTSGLFLDSYTVEGFISFAKDLYKSLEYEVVEMYLLDGDGYVIKKQAFTIEHISSVLMEPEVLSAFCLTEGASGLVMVHNHPSGNPKPSKLDDLMTKNMQTMCSMHNMLLCDHLICAKDGVYSYYMSGKMKEFSKNYSMNILIQ